MFTLGVKLVKSYEGFRFCPLPADVRRQLGRVLRQGVDHRHGELVAQLAPFAPDAPHLGRRYAQEGLGALYPLLEQGSRMHP